ncbi:UDP-glucose dehydrogenase family protein [Flaviflexus huanghaiensis]|uniref:UDP-glucose dehydrogenase family protein n=1 Tax=Flaviflexus huanghaiensis TaxID=1111473 RepID=UPI0015F846DF|nr:UDP-glucose/GDP-mannose dehydrogenase family protein [Flaviflexus huanghaiensis]
MKISVIGCGYLGAVHAACMAELGHDVIGVDVDQEKVDLLSAGRAPFHEPDFEDLLERGVSSGRLSFTTDFAQVADCRVHFIGVGTPQKADAHGADMRYVESAVQSLLPHLADRAVVVGKSTVPVGTADSLEPSVTEAGGVLVWNPEFLRESFAVKDTLQPDRLVYGLSKNPESAEYGLAMVDEVYADIIAAGTPRLLMDFPTAELVKVSANSFLAMKISFINAMAEICDATGADVTKLAEAIGLDDRIGRKFLRAGIGFGGGCLPKDTLAFQARTEELGLESLNFLTDVNAINERRRQRVVDLVVAELGEDLTGMRIAVLGAAFKPNTDDTRESPALDIAERLDRLGADIIITDPAAGPVIAARDPEAPIAADAHEAIEGANITLLLTEWDEFKSLDPTTLAPARKIIIDGRNAIDSTVWKNAGWTYYGMGRS